MHAFLLSLLLAATAAPAAHPDVAVVCPADLRHGMQSWAERRTKQGHTIEFLSNLPSAEEIRDQICSLAKGGNLKFVLLVGDAPPPESDTYERPRRTPTFRVASKVDRFWGGEDDFASDNPYADLDGDGVPDLAVGRITAHSPEELTTILSKIFAYEESRDFGAWRTKINFVAGQAGYGDAGDAFLDSIIRKLIVAALPHAYRSTLTETCWKSPFCPDPRNLHDCCLRKMDEGCLFWVFMGHGSPRTLQWAAFPDGATPILRCEDCAKLHCRGTPPIALCMCCYTGAFAERDNCLAEDLLSAPGGPVAVFSGSSITMPYGMAAMSREAIRDYFELHPKTLGQWLLATKRDTMAGYGMPVWAFANAVIKATAPEGVCPKEERLEHLQLFNLFGDPTMQLTHASEIKIDAPKTAVAGETILIRGHCTMGGTAKIEIEPPLDRPQLSARSDYDGSIKGRQQFASQYHDANESSLVSTSVKVHDGEFSVEMRLPDTAAGKCFIRAFVEGLDACAAGSVRISVDPPLNDSQAKGSRQ